MNTLASTLLPLHDPGQYKKIDTGEPKAQYHAGDRKKYIEFNTIMKP